PEALLRPPQEGVALGVAPVLPLDVPAVGPLGAELVDLHGVVDDKIGGEPRIYLLRVPARGRHGAAQRCEVHDRRDAGEVLHEDPGGNEGDPGPWGTRGPAGEGGDVVGGDIPGAAAPHQVLEKDLDGVRQRCEIDAYLVRHQAQAVDGDGSVGELQVNLSGGVHAPIMGTA